MEYPRVNQWKQPMIVPPGGGRAKGHIRVSTIKGVMNGMYGINAWECRMVAGGATLRQDLLGQISMHWPPNETNTGQMDAVIAKLKEAAGANVGANNGQILHGMTERIDRGEDFNAMPPFDADLAAYRKCIAEHGIEIVPELIERTVVHNTLGICGTFDRVVRKAGRLFVLDIKTGRDLEYQANGTTAVQLAFYANAETMYTFGEDPADDYHEPMPDVDKKLGLVLWLPVGKAHAELHVVDLEAGWEAAQHAMWVYDWRKRKDIARPARIGG